MTSLCSAALFLVGLRLLIIIAAIKQRRGKRLRWVTRWPMSVPTQFSLWRRVSTGLRWPTMHSSNISHRFCSTSDQLRLTIGGSLALYWMARREKNITNTCDHKVEFINRSYLNIFWALGYDITSYVLTVIYWHSREILENYRNTIQRNPFRTRPESRWPYESKFLQIFTNRNAFVDIRCFLLPIIKLVKIYSLVLKMHCPWGMEL